MNGPLVFIAGAVLAISYLNLISPATLVKNQDIQVQTRSEGDVVDVKGGDDHQPTVGYVPDVDSQTGARFMWIVKANGTRSKSFLDAGGSLIGTPHQPQL